MKTTVIHHSADFDGLFCREIARKFLPDAELIGWDFGQPILPFPTGKVYVLDLPCDAPFGLKFAPGETNDLDFSNFVWIDHHKSAIESHPTRIRGFRIDGVAACRLAWQYLNNRGNDGKLFNLPTKQEFIDRKVSEPMAVQLAGEYDIWDKRNPQAEIFQFGLRSRELTKFDWDMLLSNDVDEALKGTGMESTNSQLACTSLLNTGVLLRDYQRDSDSSVMPRSFIMKFEGLNFLCLNTARCNSLTFDAKDVLATGHDALMGFYYNGFWNFSLYHAKHRTDLDLSTIAVKYGGGGHRGACGFRLKSLKDIPIVT